MNRPILPSLLYRYRAFDAGWYSLRLLAHGELFFARPDQLNDPFEFSIPIRLDLLPREKRIRLYAEHVRTENPAFSAEEVEQIASAAADDPSSWDEMVEFTREATHAHSRVCSFSSVKDEILLWSHYADEHRGFCVGFQAGELENHLRSLHGDVAILPIEYDSSMPKLVPDRESAAAIYGANALTKHEGWRYEQEWRALSFDIPHPTVVVPPEIFREVAFGLQVDPKIRDIAAGVVRKRCPHVRLLQAFRDPGRFGLRFEPFEL